MRKAGYHFNSDTLSFDKIESSLRKRLWRLFKKFFSSFSLAIVMLYLVYAFIDSPKEKLLKRKYEEVLTQYSLLSNKVEHLDNVLKDMESRDDNIYRVIFETDPIPSSIRRAGSGGVDQYEHLRQIDNADLIRDKREGKFIYYELNASVLEEIMLWITDLKGASDNEGNDTEK